MFQYFPTNYVWNLSADLALEMGAKIGEINEMCAPLIEASKAGDDEGTRKWLASWMAMAEKLIGFAAEDEKVGNLFSAGEKLNRAAIYMQTAERMQPHGAPGRLELYHRNLAIFQKGVALCGEKCTRVTFPYRDSFLTGLFIPAEGVEGPQPVLVQLNGLDSTKEMLYRLGQPRMLAQRGIASLIVDQPGTGEALRLQNLPAIYNSEDWGSAIVDYLETRSDIDPKRIGMQGVSLGGYYAPRIVANEPRYALGACWGGNHDWREVQHRRLKREGEMPVPHYWEHVRWVWGAKDQDDFMKIIEDITLDGQVEKIKVPFLVVHGELDRQIPLEYAQRTYDQLVNAPERELKIFTENEGGAQHCGADNTSSPASFISDWVARRLGGHVG